MFNTPFNPPNGLTLTPIIIIIIIITIPILTKLSNASKKKVYLLDISCYKPNKSQSVTKASLLERMEVLGNLTQDSLAFCKKLMDNSGIGDSAYMAEALLTRPLDVNMEKSRKEAEEAVVGVVEGVLRKTRVAAEEVGIVVANCSIFVPAPSLSAVVVNRFGMREDVRTFNLSGMGCTASLSAVCLANQLLQVHPNTYALVVSTESITENAYFGRDRGMLVINCFFRLGGAAILLSNRPSAASAAKYRLHHAVSTHTAGSNPPSYTSIFLEEDADGLQGVTVAKNLLSSANRSIRANLTALGPLVLPLSAQLLYLAHRLLRLNPYTPRFRAAFEHVLPHVGGKPVLDELARALVLDDVDMEPSRMTLYRFGNTSSSSTWYEMAYAEAKGRVKKGDRVLQVGFGSGFKCCSLVWKAVRSVEAKEVGNPWSDEIDHLPPPMDGGGDHLNNANFDQLHFFERPN
ncbi:hypothetical protein V2J09_015616 [Rumex salicifolius]